MGVIGRSGDVGSPPDDVGSIMLAPDTVRALVPDAARPVRLAFVMYALRRISRFSRCAGPACLSFSNSASMAPELLGEDCSEMILEDTVVALRSCSLFSRRFSSSSSSKFL